MIDVKTAVEKALTFLVDMYQNEGIQDARLEEVERSEDGASWHVTLSFLRKSQRTLAPSLQEALGLRCERDYKVFTVGVEDGEVRSMKIRTAV